MGHASCWYGIPPSAGVDTLTVFATTGTRGAHTCAAASILEPLTIRPNAHTLTKPSARVIHGGVGVSCEIENDCGRQRFSSLSS